MYIVKIQAQILGNLVEFYMGDDSPIATHHGMLTGGLRVEFTKSKAKRFNKESAEYQAKHYGGEIIKIN